MKKTLLLTIAGFFSFAGFGQGQIGNSDMEQWESVATGEEPVNWNSFLSGTGPFASFANDQVESSTDVRPGSTGTKSCRIFSLEIFSIVANGNLTLGRINMGSITPTAPQNYNFSSTADVNFSEALTDHPDSIVFWAKFTPISGSGNARMKATLHTNYDYRDPEDAASSNEVVATAVLNYPSTVGSWVRFSAPFVYSGPAALASQTNILVTFTTNELGGGGTAADEVLIDDVELIYNPAGLTENDNDGIVVSMNNFSNQININTASELDGTYSVYDVMGQIVQSGVISKEISFDKISGVYFVHLISNNKTYNFEILKN